MTAVTAVESWKINHESLTNEETVYSCVTCINKFGPFRNFAVWKQTAPRIKSNILNNFRPISVLPFISKVLENFFDQLQFFLNRNCISELFQSGFESAHSTETVETSQSVKQHPFSYRLWWFCGPGSFRFTCSIWYSGPLYFDI